MKNLIYGLLAIIFLAGCNDDKDLFDASISTENITFRPTAGGAVMYYQLPVNDEIFSVKIRYTDDLGNTITCVGSYVCDSIEIIGFNEARQSIPASVTLCDRNERESEPIQVSFDTYDSGPVVFFQNADIQPYWNGFTLTYDGPKEPKGIANIFYVGTNPLTGKEELIFIDRIVLREGENTYKYSLKQNRPINTVVIRTEDYRGNIVKEVQWEDIDAYSTAFLDPEEYEFQDPEGLSVEDPDKKLGMQYLFDGDTKGVQTFRISKDMDYYTFMAGPGAKGKPFIIDFKKGQTPAMIHFYGVLSVRSFPGLWNSCYYTSLPCAVSVYGSNDKDDEDSWVFLEQYKEPRNAANTLRWCARCATMPSIPLISTLEDLHAADPAFMTVSLPASDEKWRYLKIVVDEVFARAPNSGSENLQGYVSFNELEIYVKASGI